MLLNTQEKILLPQKDKNKNVCYYLTVFVGSFIEQD